VSKLVLTFDRIHPLQFKSVEEAVRTREALYNLQWPPMGGRLLAVSFVPESEVESKVKGSAVPTSPPATSRGGATEEAGKGGPGERQRVVLPVKDRLTLPVAEKPPAAVQGEGSFFSLRMFVVSRLRRYRGLSVSQEGIG
jgi:hypothetical protein